jgi:hypothetical protein
LLFAKHLRRFQTYGRTATAIFFLFAKLSSGEAVAAVPAVNPDPNHTHADFAVYIDSKRVDFSDPKYMSTGQKHLSQYFHLHDGIGTVIHRHKPGLTLGEFFASLGFMMTPDCFTFDTKESFCTNADKKWALTVNAKEVAFGPASIIPSVVRVKCTPRNGNRESGTG